MSNSFQFAKEPCRYCGKILHKGVDAIFVDGEKIYCSSDCRDKYYIIINISKLSQVERLVLALFYFEELSSKEIAEIIDIPQLLVANILSKVFTELRSQWRLQ